MGKEKKEAAEGFTKRDFIKTALIGAAGVAAGGSLGPAILRAQAKPIKLGLLGVAAGLSACRAKRHSGECKSGWTKSTIKEGFSGERSKCSSAILSASPKRPSAMRGSLRPDRDVDIIFAHGSSAEAFAIAAISKDLKKVVFAINETTAFTADPKVRSRYCFRSTRDTLLDNIVGGRYRGKQITRTRSYQVVYDRGRLLLRQGVGRNFPRAPEEVSSQGRDYRTGLAEARGGGFHPAYYGNHEGKTGCSIQ